MKGRPKIYPYERTRINLFYPTKLVNEITAYAEKLDVTLTDLYVVAVQELLERMIMLPNVYSAENLKLKLKQIYNGDKF